MPFTYSILMVRPASFGFNEQTAANNSFQQNILAENIQHKALAEFDAMVETIRLNGIDVMVISDTADPVKPDAIFPNNWFCTMADSSVHLFPMFAKNRRIERSMDAIDQLKGQFKIDRTIHWTESEERNIFLEGTGSMVMDHDHKVIYACISERTHPKLLNQFAEATGYAAVDFKATDKNDVPVYHTNVLMCLGNNFCVICDEVVILMTAKELSPR